VAAFSTVTHALPNSNAFLCDQLSLREKCGLQTTVVLCCVRVVGAGHRFFCRALTSSGSVALPAHCETGTTDHAAAMPSVRPPLHTFASTPRMHCQCMCSRVCRLAPVCGPCALSVCHSPPSCCCAHSPACCSAAHCLRLCKDRSRVHADAVTTLTPPARRRLPTPSRKLSPRWMGHARASAAWTAAHTRWGHAPAISTRTMYRMPSRLIAPTCPRRVRPRTR
jgi:hypothetical protein